MKPITRPTQNVVDILNILKSDNIRNEVCLDIESIVGVLKDRETLYIEHVNNNILFQIPRDQNISVRVDRTKMIKYYEYRILNKPNGRVFYDELILSAPQNICPYCTIRMVKTIDHFLPKSEYPSYAITPLNLIPSCRDCNTDKKINYPTNSTEQTFHPYFDKVDTECWIKAELKRTTPLSFYFSVIRPISWDDVKLARANSHFQGYNINELFSNEANRELISMQLVFKGLHSKDKNLLKSHLHDIYTSCLHGNGPINWKTLMYQELSTNEWFIDGCTGVDFF